MQFLRRLFPSPPPAPSPGPSRPSDSTDDLLTEIAAFEEAIGYAFRDRQTLVQALLHRSYHQQSQDTSLSNERMEFLGDAILNLIAADHLYAHYPAANEGELTKIRSRLVNKRALTAYAADLDLSRFVLMSQSAAQSVGKGLDTILADTFEAVIAAVYIDGGFEEARRFVQRHVANAIRRGRVIIADENYKSMLLEYAQAQGLGVPRYTIVHEEGPDHDRTFVVDVLLGNVRRGSGRGKNKKEAEQAAAGDALRGLT